MKQLEIGTDFSGVGAFEQALIRMGINHKTVFACDENKYARQTYDDFKWNVSDSQAYKQA